MTWERIAILGMGVATLAVFIVGKRTAALEAQTKQALLAETWDDGWEQGAAFVESHGIEGESNPYRPEAEED